MRAAVEDDAAIRTEHVCKARRFAAACALLAEPAFERRSDSLSPTLRLEHPRSELERRLVPHVPLVSAGKLGDPVAALVLAVTDDCLFHAAP